MEVNEGLVLNGLSLNSGPEPAGPYTLEVIDMTPPKKKPEWADGADSDGAGLVREPLYENRTVTAKIRIEPQTTMNAALEKLAAIVDQLQEASKNPGGIPLVWTPSNSTKSITFYTLEGEVTGLPIEVQGDQAGWFVKAPILSVQMVCKPFGYGTEEEVRSAIANETGLSIVTFTLASIKGDVPAEGRLVLTDTAAVSRRYVEWGLEQRYYNAATSLILDSEDMTPVSGAQSTEYSASGAYKRPGATKGTIATTLVASPTICCNTGVLKHVGSFRVKARVRAKLGATGTLENVFLRLAYQDNEGPFRANAWQTPSSETSFCEVDLGVITVTPTESGTQKWLGQIEAYSLNTAVTDVLHVDYLTFIPIAEGYGKARGLLPQQGGTVAAYDNFESGTLSGVLSGRPPGIGAAWVTSGATTDFAVEAGAATRTTAADSQPRFGQLGAALGNSRVEAICEASSTHKGNVLTGVVARWVNSNSYAFLDVVREGSNNRLRVRLGVLLAGVSTVLKEQYVPYTQGAVFVFEASLTATLDGALYGTGSVVRTDATGEAAVTLGTFNLAASSSAVATGGALESGKIGIYDQNVSGEACRRAYRLAAVTVLPAIPYCIPPSQSMEVRSNSTLAEDGTGTYSGPVPQYRGSRFYVPQAGEANRTSRILVKADRNDLEESDQAAIGDAFTAQVFVTPRYLVVPR